VRVETLKVRGCGMALQNARLQFLAPLLWHES
jgi:hypothetical protein